MAFRLELSASFDYFDNLLPDFPRLVARTSFSSTVLLNIVLVDRPISVSKNR